MDALSDPKLLLSNPKLNILAMMMMVMCLSINGIEMVVMGPSTILYWET